MQTFGITIDTSKAGDTTATISVQGDDKLYYRFVSTGTSTITTAAVKYYTRRDSTEPPLEVSTITIDGTAGEIDVSKIAFISFTVTTAEANTKGDLFVYTRKNQE